MYAQQEGIGFEETFSLVARLEAIRIFLAFSTFQQFKIHQMNVKYAFLNGDLEEEVYIDNQKDSFWEMMKNFFAYLKSLYMVPKKLLEHGTIILTNIFNNKVSQKELLIVSYTQKFMINC